MIYPSFVLQTSSIKAERSVREACDTHFSITLLLTMDNEISSQNMKHKHVDQYAEKEENVMH